MGRGEEEEVMFLLPPIPELIPVQPEPPEVPVKRLVLPPVRKFSARKISVGPEVPLPWPVLPSARDFQPADNSAENSERPEVPVKTPVVPLQSEKLDACF